MSARTEVARPISSKESSKTAIPLAFIPEARKRLVSYELISVASHELNHALAALAYGVSVDSISVIPAGDSLGRTCLGGLVGDEVLKVIAAGGGVHTHEGSAWGYGSDKYKVDSLHYLNGGHSWNSAKNQAEAILREYSNAIRRKAAEIIAYFGEVSGSMLGEIIQRAQFELREEGAMITEELPEMKINNNRYDEYTIIEELPNNNSRVRYIVGKIEKNDKEKIICRICSGINTHEEKCLNKFNVSEANDNKLKNYKFPSSGTIFSSN